VPWLFRTASASPRTHGYMILALAVIHKPGIGRYVLRVAIMARPSNATFCPGSTVSQENGKKSPVLAMLCTAYYRDNEYYCTRLHAQNWRWTEYHYMTTGWNVISRKELCGRHGRIVDKPDGVRGSKVLADGM
jgi:hypothetical protein